MASNDGPAAEWKQQGTGPHSTLAGNLYDPNVGADGKMAGGQGVGGTSEKHIKEEGMEHIKQTIGQSDGATGTSETAGLAPIETAKPPASNPGAEDASAGIAGGQGGVSSTAHIDSPVTDAESQKTYLGSAMEYLGLAPKTSKEASPLQDAATNDQAEQARNNDMESSASGEARGTAGVVAGGAAATGAAAAGAVGAGETQRNLDDTAKDTQQATGNTEPTTSKDVTMGDTSGADKDATGATEGVEKSGDSEHKPPQPADAARETGAKAEHRDAIPTAGGERLGEQHWGESKIVADNPKPPPAEEKGVSSADGQPTCKSPSSVDLLA